MFSQDRLTCGDTEYLSGRLNGEGGGSCQPRSSSAGEPADTAPRRRPAAQRWARLPGNRAPAPPCPAGGTAPGTRLPALREEGRRDIYPFALLRGLPDRQHLPRPGTLAARLNPDGSARTTPQRALRPHVYSPRRRRDAVGSAAGGTPARPGP